MTIGGLDPITFKTMNCLFVFDLSVVQLTGEDWEAEKYIDVPMLRDLRFRTRRNAPHPSRCG
jgi:hypothetical protein